MLGVLLNMATYVSLYTLWLLKLTYSKPKVPGWWSRLSQVRVRGDTHSTWLHGDFLIVYFQKIGRDEIESANTTAAGPDRVWLFCGEETFNFRSTQSAQSKL